MSGFSQTRVVVMMVLAGLFLLGGCIQSGGGNLQGTSSNGRVVFAITDASADMSNVSKVDVTIDNVSVQSAQKGWVTVSNTPQTYDLLELKTNNRNALLADVNLEAGTYNQLRLHVSSVRVTDDTGTYEATLPSNELKIVGQLVVTRNATSTATFDFVADESLHVTGNGEYILAPVIQVETRSNTTVSVSSTDEVRISGGNIQTSTKMGMGTDGKIGIGVAIPADKVLDIDAQGVIHMANAQGKVIVGITDAAANLQDVTKLEVTIDQVDIHSDANGWITLTENTQTIDLLELKDNNWTSVLGEAQLGEGSYQQIRLIISKVMVTDANGTHEAKLPSGELKLAGELDVKEGETSTIIVDFLADQSLHLTGKGEYLLAPVVQLETRNHAQADVDSSNHLRITSGEIITHDEQGMNEDGEVGVNIHIPANAVIHIGENGAISVT